MSRTQKPSLRDFSLLHSNIRSWLCSENQSFDPCDQLSYLSSLETSTLNAWAADSKVDKGLNLYILLHILSAVNGNSVYYHYVNNGNPDGTNMFGHIIGTSGDSVTTSSVARTQFTVQEVGSHLLWYPTLMRSAGR